MNHFDIWNNYISKNIYFFTRRNVFCLSSVFHFFASYFVIMLLLDLYVFFFDFRVWITIFLVHFQLFFVTFNAIFEYTTTFKHLFQIYEKYKLTFFMISAIISSTDLYSFFLLFTSYRKLWNFYCWNYSIVALLLFSLKSYRCSHFFYILSLLFFHLFLVNIFCVCIYYNNILKNNLYRSLKVCIIILYLQRCHYLSSEYQSEYE